MKLTPEQERLIGADADALERRALEIAWAFGELTPPMQAELSEACHRLLPQLEHLAGEAFDDAAREPDAERAEVLRWSSRLIREMAEHVRSHLEAGDPVAPIAAVLIAIAERSKR